MCGIVGKVSFGTPVDPTEFNAMRDTLSHRGPDGYGSEFLAAGRVALGHRRLSILDLSEAGRQPMTNEDGRIWLTFNGEIYNYPELRDELLRAGHAFRSHSDTEVLIHGYEEWGLPALLGRLRGMFAFGLWDDHRQELFVVRDRFGIKPIIYYSDRERFVFASEIKACTRDPDLSLSLDEDALADYFIYSYIPHPRTVWRGLHKLRPGHYLRVGLGDGKVTQHRYWKPEPGYRRLRPEEATEEANARLRRAVTEHLVSDVPVGVFLSGGYDSTSVLMHMHDAGRTPDSFSLGFAGSERSEHHAAAAIAEGFGSRHHARLLNADDELFPLVERLVAHYDEPFAVSSQLTYHHVSELAARTHKVVLSGDGGDEVFAGYTWYAGLAEERLRWKRYARALLGRRSLRDQTTDSYGRRMTGVGGYLGRRQEVSPDLRRRIRERSYGYFEQHYPRGRGLVKNVQQLDVDTFLLDNCLQRADMSSMLHSLEVRVPFLDHTLFEWVYSLHPSVYFSPQEPKQLIRRNLRGRVDDAVLARAKQGFGFQHRNQLLGPGYAAFVNGGELRRRGLLVRDLDFSTLNGEMAFHFVFLEQWLRTH